MNNQLKIAALAAIEGGAEIMKIYQQDDLGVEYKQDESPLTIADKNCNDIINRHLLKTDIPIISEENKQLDYSKRKGWTQCWIVDPLDGTKEFVKRNGEFTVNIALVANGQPILGVIYVPVSKELYLADVNDGLASKIQLKSHDVDFDKVNLQEYTIGPSKADQSLIRVVGSRSHMNEATENFVKELSNNDQRVEIVSKGSSLKFCLVAEGKADVYPRFAPTMEWDTAAGQAICQAAGLEVISKDTDQPLLYNKENLLNPWFVVGK